MIKVNYEPQNKQMIFHSIGSYQWAGINPQAMTPEMVDYAVDVLDNKLIHYATYGGARGGGKSACVSGEAPMLALRFPGCKILILREELSSLTASIKGNLDKFLLDDNKEVIYKKMWSSGESRMILFPNNSKIYLDYVNGVEDAKVRLRGREFDFIFIDEETLHGDDVIAFLQTINRPTQHFRYADGTIVKNPKTDKPLPYPTFFRTSCNPGGLGHVRVRNLKRETKGGQRIVVQRIKTKSGKEVVRRKYFIQSLYYDNVYSGDDYEVKFLDLTEKQRRMELEGDFEVAEGVHFENFDRKYHVTEKGEVEVKRNYKVWLSLDWGTHQGHAMQLHTALPSGRLHTFKDWFSTGGETIEEVSEYARDIFIEERKIEFAILPHDMFRRTGTLHRNENGEVMGETKAEVFQRITGIPCVMGSRDRVHGWDRIHSLQHMPVDEEGKKEIRWTIDESCTETIDEFQSVISDPNNPSEIQTRPKQKDHMVDAFRMFAGFTSTDQFKPKPRKEHVYGTCGYYKDKIENENKEENTYWYTQEEYNSFPNFR